MTDSYKAILEDAITIMGKWDNEGLLPNDGPESHYDLAALIVRKQALEAGEKQHHSLEAAPLVVHKPNLKM